LLQAGLDIETISYKPLLAIGPADEQSQAKVLIFIFKKILSGSFRRDVQ
jgi:hypothetical protein